MKASKFLGVITVGLGLTVLCCCSMAIYGSYLETTPEDQAISTVRGATQNEGMILSTSENSVQDLMVETGTVVSHKHGPENALTVVSLTTPTPLPTKTPLPANTSQATRTIVVATTLRPQVQVNISSANIRSGPGTNYPPIDVAERGDVFTILATDSSQDWYNILMPDGKRGWIGASVVNVLGTLSNVDVALTVPAAPESNPVTSNSNSDNSNNTPLPTNEPAAVCNCSGDSLNCGNFGSQSSAQACFNYCYPIAGDIHRLDRDNDGIACEG